MSQPMRIEAISLLPHGASTRMDMLLSQYEQLPWSDFPQDEAFAEFPGAASHELMFKLSGADHWSLSK